MSWCYTHGSLKLYENDFHCTNIHKYDIAMYVIMHRKLCKNITFTQGSSYYAFATIYNYTCSQSDYAVIMNTKC